LFSFNSGPGARRRRQKQTEKDDVRQKTFLSLNIGDLLRKRGTIDRLYQPRTLSKDDLVGNIPAVRDSMTSHSPLDMRLKPSNPLIAVTNVEEHRVSSTVSVKKISRASIDKMNSEKPNEIKSAQIKPDNNGNKSGSTSATPHSAVTVIRVNKVSSMDDIDKINSNTTRQNTPRAISRISKKTGIVNVTKLLRIKSNKAQRPRAVSAGNVSVTHVHRSSIQMQPLANRAKTSMPVPNSKANTGNGVTVIKLPRKPTISESDRT
jgi:hypothetical protein